MFRVIEDPQWDEAVPVAAPDGSVQELATRFRAVPLAELRAVEAGEATLPELLERAVVGFSDLADASGDPVDPAEWRGRVLALPWVQTALYRHYSLALYRARAGNSAPSAGTGQPAG